jgi:hypothetical protein
VCQENCAFCTIICTFQWIAAYVQGKERDTNEVKTPYSEPPLTPAMFHISMPNLAARASFAHFLRGWTALGFKPELAHSRVETCNLKPAVFVREFDSSRIIARRPKPTKLGPTLINKATVGVQEPMRHPGNAATRNASRNASHAFFCDTMTGFIEDEI